MASIPVKPIPVRRCDAIMPPNGYKTVTVSNDVEAALGIVVEECDDFTSRNDFIKQAVSGYADNQPDEDVTRKVRKHIPDVGGLQGGEEPEGGEEDA